MKRIKHIAIMIVLLAFTALTVPLSLYNNSVSAAECNGTGLSGGVNCAGDANISKGGDLNNIMSTVINTILFVVGILSVIMLIYGGIKYSMSAGDTAKVTSAKNTVMYAIVGLIISILAYAIVNWVIGVFQN